jgi:quercetin dioxygenase-like cupin family protein
MRLRDLRGAAFTDNGRRGITSPPYVTFGSYPCPRRENRNRVRAMTDPAAFDLPGARAVTHDPGVTDREVEVGGTRWALVEYSPGSGREEWCDVPHSGCMLSGSLTYSFEDGREPLELSPGEAFVLPPSPRHRGRNEGSEPARLFLIDALAGG